MIPEFTQVKHIGVYRFIGSVLKLKSKLNFLIPQYVRSNKPLVINFNESNKLFIQPSAQNLWTINELIFEGLSYIPEHGLLKKIMKNLPPGYTYIDVGGNLGTTLCAFYNKQATIIVFEPMPHLYACLQQTVAINNWKNVELIQKAVGKTVGEVIMHKNDNSSISQSTEVTDELIKINITYLDNFADQITRCDLIKIDVEGFEWMVLQGAKKIIDLFKPKLLIELHPQFIKHYGDNISEILDFLEDKNYLISYYNFLPELRVKSSIARLVSRYGSFKNAQLNSRAAFMDDLNILPHVTSYHIYCEPA
ncbi:MAG: FkbM family methyltransferase [Methylotenera sp.]|nr:FkbM family methyltransferase [Flavobacterium sp.]